jgi:hypothetical protein
LPRTSPRGARQGDDFSLPIPQLGIDGIPQRIAEQAAWPTVPPMKAALKPTISSMRAPNTKQERMFRPSGSAPSQWVRLGASIGTNR